MGEVLINGFDIGKFVEMRQGYSGGFNYRGKALEDEGQKVERWLRDAVKEGVKVRVEDLQEPKYNGVYEVIIADGNWDKEKVIFSFLILLEKPKGTS